MVVIAQNVEDVRKALAYARRRQESVTFRAAGTSLSGQAQGDGMLIDVRRDWAGVEVEGGGRRLRARPGTILARANLALHVYGYRLGPDPASASACTIGGVVANSSSGMCCGTTQNSYKTLSSLSFMLPSGAFIDTAKPDAEREFATAKPALAAPHGDQGEIEADPRLTARSVRSSHQEHDGLSHGGVSGCGCWSLGFFRCLIVGSEGTLAFIAEAVFETVPDDQYRAHLIHDLSGHAGRLRRGEAVCRPGAIGGARQSCVALRWKASPGCARTMENVAGECDRALGLIFAPRARGRAPRRSGRPTRPWPA